MSLPLTSQAGNRLVEMTGFQKIFFNYDVIPEPSGTSSYYLNRCLVNIPPSVKSFQSGLHFSVRSIFHCRFHFFNRFSLLMASLISINISKWTNLSILYRLVNPLTILVLCSINLLFKSFVTPMYKTPYFLLARMYTKY